MIDGSFERNIWMSVGLIVGTLALFGGTFSWLTNDLSTRATAIIADRDQIRQHAQAIEKLATLKQSLPQVKQYQDAMNALIPTRDELLDFPRWVESLARVNRVSPTFIFRGGNVDPRGEDPGYVGFQLDVGGGYTDLIVFFDTLEQKSTRFLVALDSFDVSETSPGSYRIVTQGRVFYR